VTTETSAVSATEPRSSVRIVMITGKLLFG
jgi:hypothetical protein